ncbi:dolichyl-diphosphooligosaccharide--protein glycosyltransferase subunit 2 [Apium graveolens]|uniref:dolichyl-diphosphooligosaccharide--protein glycosyltransferase subunit 2 n=1 Tax=Apium graveolens TaxID=4045 RepID=UPI003D7BD063
MARYLGFLILILSISSICVSASLFYPISDAHRSAASEIFTFSDTSLEATYEALATFEVLGIGAESDVKTSTCKSVVDTLSLPTSTMKDLFFGLRVNKLLKCELTDGHLMAITLRIKDSVKDANSLLDFYYSIGSLIDIKGQTSEVDVTLENADGIFRSIKALSQSDGKWRYSSNNPESSSYAAGLALETLGGVVSLASSEIDEYLITTVKNDIMKLFDSIEKYDDGAYYFDEKLLDASGHHGPLSASSSVVRGLTAFAHATSTSLNLPGDKISGLAKFFLGIGVPGNAKDLYYQIDGLACLESNRVLIPLIQSIQSTVISYTRNDKLKVRVTTVLGYAAPPLSVKLMQVFSSGSKDASIIDQELTFDSESGIHILEALPESVDVGKYTFVFEIVLHDAELKKIYATGGRTKVPIFVTGVMQVDNAKIAVLDSDLGSVETQKKLSFEEENSVSLSANHLQKLRVSFQLSTPLGNAFNPHQAFLKLTHETKVEHIFMVGSSGKQFSVVLDFLGLVDKFFYLSGRYDIQLTVGDAVMENSFMQALGHVELDLPEPPEKATRPPPQSVDPYLRYGPKDEISHIFRTPEKLPRQELSLAFSSLILLPFIGFLVGLLWLGVNLKSFPTSTVPATFAILFHVGIGAVLCLYALFWIKLDLFTTLKALGFLGIFLMFVGHRTLSHIASTSAKLKSA